jgi:hypothetical protein
MRVCVYLYISVRGVLLIELSEVTPVSKDWRGDRSRNTTKKLSGFPRFNPRTSRELGSTLADYSLLSSLFNECLVTQIFIAVPYDTFKLITKMITDFLTTPSFWVAQECRLFWIFVTIGRASTICFLRLWESLFACSYLQHDHTCWIHVLSALAVLRSSRFNSVRFVEARFLGGMYCPSVSGMKCKQNRKVAEPK